MALAIINLMALTLLVLTVEITPSQQRRKPDPASMVLEISEAGEVKQIPLIQPALDAISGFWSSFSTTESKVVATPTKAQAVRISTPRVGSKPIKTGVVTVKPVIVNPVSNVKPTEIVKPLAYHPVVAKPSKNSKLKTTTAKTSTTEKAILKTTIKLEQTTVTPKEVSIPIISTLPTDIKSSSEQVTKAETTVMPTTTSVRPSTNNDVTQQMTPVPAEYVLRLEELLFQLQEYNNELTNARKEINI